MLWLALGDPVVRSTTRSRLQFDFKVCVGSVSPTPDYRGCWAGREEGHRRFSQHFWKRPQGSHCPPPPAEGAIYAGYGESVLGQTVLILSLTSVGRVDSNPTLVYIQSSSSFFKKIILFICFWLG